jgi:predicted acyl esterase
VIITENQSVVAESQTTHFGMCYLHGRVVSTLTSLSCQRIVLLKLPGRHKREDVSAMVDKYGLFNDYWDDKKPKLRNITVPMYATASYSTGLHTEGSVRGFMLSKSKEKW